MSEINGAPPKGPMFIGATGDLEAAPAPPQREALTLIAGKIGPIDAQLAAQEADLQVGRMLRALTETTQNSPAVITGAVVAVVRLTIAQYQTLSGPVLVRDVVGYLIKIVNHVAENLISAAKAKDPKAP